MKKENSNHESDQTFSTIFLILCAMDTFWSGRTRGPVSSGSFVFFTPVAPHPTAVCGWNDPISNLLAFCVKNLPALLFNEIQYNGNTFI